MHDVCVSQEKVQVTQITHIYCLKEGLSIMNGEFSTWGPGTSIGCIPLLNGTTKYHIAVCGLP